MCVTEDDVLMLNGTSKKYVLIDNYICVSFILIPRKMYIFQTKKQHEKSVA